MKAILKLALFALVGSVKANELHGSEGSTDSKMTVIKEKNSNEMLNGAWSLNKALLEPDASPDEMDIDLEEGGCFWTGCKKGGCPRGYTEIRRSGLCWRYRTEYCCKSPTPKPTKPPTNPPTKPPTRTKEECIEQECGKEPECWPDCVRCSRRDPICNYHKGRRYNYCITSCERSPNKRIKEECIEHECRSCSSDDGECITRCTARYCGGPSEDVFASEDGGVVIPGDGDVAGKKLGTGDGDIGLETLAPRRSLRKVQI